MKSSPFYISVLVAGFAVTSSVFAQGPSMNAPVPKYQGMPNQASSFIPPQQRPAYIPAEKERLVFPNFPTPDELARMTPPEPLTEERIRQRYARLKENIEKNNEQDRKEAEKYAQDFAKYQKYQAEQLHKIMAQAEQQRNNMLNKIAQQEQRALEHFRQQQTPESVEPTQY